MDALSECFIKEADALLTEHSTISHEWLHRSRYAELMLRGSESSGFDVRVLAGTTEVIVYVEGAETRFCALKKDHVPDVVQDAMEFIRSLLSPITRLRTRFADGRAYGWTVEHNADGKWVPELKAGLLIWNYFGQRSETIRQNHHLPAAVATE